MTSAINPQHPIYATPTTQSVRDNFATAAAEITALQANSATRTEMAQRLPLAGGTLTGILTLAGAPAAPLDAATKGYVDAASFLRLIGGSMTGPLLLDAAPAVTLGAATKGYVDNVVHDSENAAGQQFLRVAGGAMNGQLLLAFDPVESRGAATKHYVDVTVSGVAGITEAPNDGFSYGRGSIAWQRTLPLGGGTLTGTLTQGTSALPAGAVPSLNVADIAMPMLGSIGFNCWRNTGRTWTYKTDGAASILFMDEATDALTCVVAEAGEAGEVLSLRLAFMIDTTGNFISHRNIMAASVEGGVGGFVGSWDRTADTGTNAGFWNNANTIWFGNADGQGAVSSTRAQIDPNGLFTAAGIRSVTISAVAPSGWAGAALQVGSNWPFCWEMTADVNGLLYLRRGDVNAATVWDSAGSVTMPGHLTMLAGNIWATGGTVTAWQLTATGNASVAGTMTAAAINSSGEIWAAGGMTAAQVTASNATVHGTLNVASIGTNQLQVAGQGIIYIAYSAFPIAFTWDGIQMHGIVNGQGIGSFLCDERIKTVTGPYARGLTEIMQIDPIVYRYLGNDHAKDAHNLRNTDKQHIGVNAQKVEQVIPEMVTRRSGYIDGVAVDDLRDLDTGPLIFSMLNGMKELAGQVSALTQRVQQLEATHAG